MQYSRKMKLSGFGFGTGKSQMKSLLFLGAILLSVGCPDIHATEIIDISKTKLQLTSFEDKPGLRVLVDRPIRLKPKFFGMFGEKLEIAPGTYRDAQQAIVDGRQVVLLPVLWVSSELARGGAETKRKTLSNGYGSAGSVGACYVNIGNLVAVEISSGNVLSRVVGDYDRQPSCGKGGMYNWDYQISSIIDPGELKVVWGRDLIDADRAVESAALEKAASLKRLEKGLAAYSRPLKQRIGTRICRSDKGVDYAGFTEAVSPDNGKIQIRVSEARLAGAPTLSPGGFTSKVIWDHPDNWEVCE